MSTQARIALLIDDIPCAACAEDLEKILLGMEGISKVAVEYKEGRMEVLYDPDVVGDKDILRKIMKAGIRIIKREGSR